MDSSPAIRPFDQLIASGWTADGLKRAARSGQLQRLRRGVFRVGPVPADRQVGYRELVIATALEAGDPLVSHVSAAAIYDLPLVDADLDWVHTTCARTAGGQRKGGVHRHVGHRLDGMRRIDGVRVTSPARTLVDLARTSSWRTGVSAMDEAVRTGLVERSELAEELSSCGRQHGLPRARVALRLADGRSESPGESVSKVIFHAAGIALPVSQVEIFSRTGRFLGRSDFWFEGTATIGEFDGLVKYGQIPDGPDARTALIDEKLREDAIRDEGGILARWIWRDLYRADELASRIRRAIEIGRRSVESGHSTLTFRPVT
ncbi:hypothetical protein ABLG96_18315 [Nakamurella sp. A5-74]|uniref:Type IV toxin-antitoxin system AbiEi family antitoxin domain-containing protein n=1 Tax=Nakamurella sp. A5-74 TaxID=3158264 RepID=A0AAU8DP76_9ACTN